MDLLLRNECGCEGYEKGSPTNGEEDCRNVEVTVPEVYTILG